MLSETIDFSRPTLAGAAAQPGINGVLLNPLQQPLSTEELRQRACTELLRQTVIAAGRLDAADPAPGDGAISEAASEAIAAWLEQELQLPDPSEAACRRHHAAHPARYRSGERVRVRHILFAVTPGMDVVRLRNRAETCLLDVRCHDGSGVSTATGGGSEASGANDANAANAANAANDGFSKSARELSNCPSGEHGGDLGWLANTDCAPEFARELFGHVEVGVLPRLVHSRFGLHVVEVIEREGGVAQSFESVRGAVATALRQQTYVAALRQYLQVLAGQAVIEGVDLAAASSPLVQ